MPPVASPEAPGLQSPGELPQQAELPQAAPPPVPPPVPPAAPMPSDPATGAVDPSQANPAVTATPPLADDADLIEKAWVEKAKALVEQTSHDPYAQNRELQKFKADYLKKRYNKEIPVNE